MTTLEQTDLIDQARRLGEFAGSLDAQADMDCHLDDAVIEKIKESGLISIVRSRRLGGMEASPTTYIQALEAIAEGSGSAAWVMQVLTIHEWFMSYTSPQLQEEVYGANPHAVVVDAVAPVGIVTPTEGGFQLSGTWRYVSGINWADWAAVGGVTTLEEGAGTPEPCLFFVPKSDLTIEYDWNPIGLRGSASNTVRVEDQFVPIHRVFPIGRVAATGEPAGERLDVGDLYQGPFAPMLCTAIFPITIGLARNALREFRAHTQARVRPYEAGAEQRQNPSAQITLADATARIDAMHALAMQYAGQLEQYASERRTVLSVEERERLFAWRGLIANTCAEVIEGLYRAAGASALFPGHPLERIFRDIHAATVHVSLLYGDAMINYGRSMFGGPGHPMF
jgi:3-hydroxy-9,10-secoandrosta-1,3,5(10)-triene-9,17-dione monooxygenase